MTASGSPENWVSTNLGSILELNYGKSLPAKDRDGEGAPVYGSNGIVGLHSSPFVQHEGIVVGRKGSFGEVHISTKPFSAIDTTYYIDEIWGLPIKYWYYQLRCLPLTQLNRSSAIPGLNREDAYDQRISFPPLAEQQQIATRLDALLAQVGTLKTRLDAIPAILKRLRQSVLAAAVSGRLTEEWRRENKTRNIDELVEEINRGKQGKLKVRITKGLDEGLNLFELPKNWSWTLNYKLAVDESSAICAGPFGTIFKAKDFRQEGVPIIFLRHVKEAGFNQNKPNYMDPDVWAEYHQEYSVHGGELLVTKLGDPPGESCIYPSDQGTAMVTPDVLKMDVDTRVAETEYLKYFFNSPLSKDMIKELAFGATRLRIDIAMFKGFPIPLPPRDEQTEIVRCVEQLIAFVDQIEQRVKDAQSLVNNLTQSILAKAFRGELTAEWREQNPDLISGENSAEALLARIKTEKLEAVRANKSIRKSVKTKAGKNMKPKMIIPVAAALEAAGTPLAAQALLTQSGYSSDATTEDLERFFLDIRDQVKLGSILRERSGGDDIFTLVN